MLFPPAIKFRSKKERPCRLWPSMGSKPALTDFLTWRTHMPTQPDPAQTHGTSRRQFLKDTSVAGSTIALGLPLAGRVHAAGNDKIKFGLIGCGGRGTGAAINAMNAGKDVQLVAVADVFEDKAQASLARLKKAKPDQVAVDKDHCFVGFDAYQKLIDCGIDVAVIACSSHFQSMFLKAAVDAGKHVFVEKPHSLDVPGLKRVMATCEDARKKGLSRRLRPLLALLAAHARDDQSHPGRRYR